MATLDASVYPTAAHVARTLDPDGTPATIIEQLTERNPILEDAPWMPTNDTLSNVTTRRTSLPSPGRRRINQGVTPSTSNTTQVRDVTTSREDWHVMDEKLMEVHGANAAAFRMAQETGFVEGFSQALTYDMLYGSTATDPESMSGFMTRYASPSSTEYAANVIDAGSADTDNTSILLVRWGPLTAHCLYPKNSAAGLQRTDHGLKEVQEVVDSEVTIRMAFKTQFKWSYGLAIPDPRAVARIGSIEVSALSDKTPTEGAALFDYMVEALTVTDQGGMGATRPCFYANQTIVQNYYQQAYHKSNAHLTLGEVTSGGSRSSDKVMLAPFFLGVPIKRLDQITSTEAAV